MADTDSVEDFLDALKREIHLRSEQLGAAAFETVFFGGGTPSLLTPRQLDAVLTCLRTTFRIAPGAEITIEANPGTVTRETLAAFRSLGVNRLSIGIQSFNDGELTLLGRIHDGNEAIRCVDWSRSAGFENIGVDLIYSIPGQTLGSWDATLRAAVSLAPQHIAAYGLIVEDGTPLARMIQTRQIQRNPADREAAMYTRTMELFAAHGYEHYEVSNYAVSGFRCRHNVAYWSHEDYLGLGPSAHSFRRSDESRRRWWNVADLSTYMERLARGVLPVAAEEDFDGLELALERILLGLRSAGLNLARLTTDLGYDVQARQDGLIRWLVREQLAVLEGVVLRLTPGGYLLCDEICARLSREVGLHAPAMDHAARVTRCVS